MRIKNSKPSPPPEFFREARLRANRYVKPHVEAHNGAQFIIAPNGMRIPLQSAENVPALFEIASAALRPKAVKLS